MLTSLRFVQSFRVVGALVLAAVWLVLMSGSASAQCETGVTWTPHESNRQWTRVASSADATKLVAVVYGGQIYTSTDSGATWTARASNQQWWSVASSANGSKLVAVAYNGQIYTSTDSGVSWIARASNQSWTSVASSADGTKLVAVVQNGRIYTSANSGVTWTARASNQDWTSVASSADGSKLVAAAQYPGQIYTSTNSGVTWTPRESNRSWTSVASSADGTKLVAVGISGQIYTSTDSGVTWTPRESSRVWVSVASSADGAKLVAAAQDRIYTSTDSGVNWAARPRQSNVSWQSVASSADGTKLVAVPWSGQIYTSDTSDCTTTPLILNCATDKTVECGTAWTFDSPSALGGCSGDNVSLTILSTLTNGVCPEVITRTWQATDACNDTATCSQTVTVVDTTPPVLVGVLPDATVQCDAVPVPATVMATDNCDPAPTVSFNEARLDGNCRGNYVLKRTWTATDACGNASSQTQTITVQDTTPPVLAGMPGDVTVECSAVPAAANPTAIDNCDPAPTVSFNEARVDGNCPSIYVLKRTWTATDTCGNASSQTQTITVQDTTPPVLAGVPGSVTVECSAVPAPASPTAIDNCNPAPTVSFNEARLDGNCPGNYVLKRTWTAKDACGNTVSLTQTITVQDTKAPVLAGVPADVTVECNAVPVPTTVTATDNCDPAPAVSFSEVRVDGNCPSSYVLKRTWTAKDACGNTSSVIQTITVQDTAPPVFTSPVLDQSYSPGTQPGLSVGIDPDYVRAQTFTVGMAGTLSQVDVWIYKQAAGGNTAQDLVCELRNTISGGGPAPGPALATVAMSATSIGTTPGWVSIPLSSGVPVIPGNVLAIVLSLPTAPAGSGTDYSWPGGSGYPAGGCYTTTPASPGAWLSIGGDLGFMTYVSQAGFAPDKTVQCGSVWTFDTPAAIDACSGANAAVTILSTVTTGVCPQIITRTWQTTDACNNSATCSQTVTVVDTTPPRLVGVPEDVMVECSAVPAPATVMATDNCDTAPTVSFNEVRVDGNCPGNYVLKRTWTAQDACGNVSSLTQTITVQDTKAPVITQAAADLTVECDGAANTASLNAWLASNGGASAADNCSQVTWTRNFTALSDGCGETGSASVTFTATDACGNNSSTTATFKIIDTTAPTLTWKANTVVVDNALVFNITPNQPPVTIMVRAADICGSAFLDPLRVTCHAINGAGKIVDKSGSCVINISGGTVTVINSGGVGTFITIFASAIDECGNSTGEKKLVIEVKNPGLGGGTGAKGNEGLGNGVDGNTPGHDNNGGNDDPGTSPGNPGAKTKTP